MKQTKKILLGLGLIPILTIPLVTISCGSKEVTYFEADNLKISSEGMVMGYADPIHKQFGSLVIKEKYNGTTIKHIADRAFEDQIGIDEVILPKTLVSIGVGAFVNVKSPVSYFADQDPMIPVSWDLSHLVNLESIGRVAFYSSKTTKQNLSLNLRGLSKLKTIGDAAFASRGISSVNFEGVNSLELIGESAFEDNQLTSLTLPSITTIGEWAFEGNKILSLDLSNSSIDSIGNFAFTSNQLTSLTLPNSITTIGSNAFAANQLTSLTLPNSLTKIGGAAFAANQLTSLTLPNSITTIDDSAFFNNQLTSLTLPNSITTIYDSAFNKNKLTALMVPDSVTTIGDIAFGENPFTDLANIKLPEKFNTEAERQRIGIVITPPTPVIKDLPYYKEEEWELKDK